MCALKCIFVYYKNKAIMNIMQLYVACVVFQKARVTSSRWNSVSGNRTYFYSISLNTRIARRSWNFFNKTFCTVKVSKYRSQPVWSGKIQRDPGRAGLIAFQCLIRSSQFGERTRTSKIRWTNLLFMSLFILSVKSAFNFGIQR